MTKGTLNFNGHQYVVGSTNIITLGNGFTLNIGAGGLGAWTGYGPGLNVNTGAAVNITTGSISWMQGFPSLVVTGTGTFNCGSGFIGVCNGISIDSPNFNAGTSTIQHNYSSESKYFINSTIL